MDSSSAESPVTVFIWIVPRTCSTALAKCLTFVNGAQVWMEPYLSSFTNETCNNPEFRKGDPHMEKLRAEFAALRGGESTKALREAMQEKIRVTPKLIDQSEIGYSWVKEELETADPGIKYVIVKDQSFAAIDHLDFLPDVPNCRHVFLIRHPRDVYFSYKKLFAASPIDPTADPTPWEDFHIANVTPYLPVPDFFQIHHRLWNHLRKHAAMEPVVVDAYDLFSRPRDILPKFFAKLGIPFEERLLEWDGSDEVTQTWKGSAEIVLAITKTPFYSRAVKSSRFEAPSHPRGIPCDDYESKMTPEIKEYTDAAMPFYEEMYAQRIQ